MINLKSKKTKGKKGMKVISENRTIEIAPETKIELHKIVNGEEIRFEISITEESKSFSENITEKIIEILIKNKGGL